LFGRGIKSSPLRILVVSQYFWPENFRINDLVEEFVRRGHEVTVLTGRPNYPDGQFFRDFLENPSHFNEYKGATVVRVPILPRGQGGVRLLLNYISFALSASFIGPWRLSRRKFDAIFAYEPSPITVGIPAAVMRAFTGAPLTFWVLDLWPETLEAIGVVRSKVMLKLIGSLVSTIYAHCDLILAQSNSFIPQIARYAGRGRRIEYFPSWAESLFVLQGGELAPEVTVKSGCFNIMFAGNIGESQDFPAILSAAEQLRAHSNIRWLIVGDGRMAGWVTEEIKKRALEHSVLMLGRYPVERMPSFFRHADALLLSLKDEPIFAMTIPGKLQSYLASGIPLLAMLNGEGSAVIQNAQAGLTCPAGDYAALAEAVLQLSAMSNEERKTMGMRGKALSDDEFGRKKLIDQLEGWLEELQIRGAH
jgi:colanic acid biosynthesis glycosyl transferase WcaI